jgi:hypothetical protein
MLWQRPAGRSAGAGNCYDLTGIVFASSGARIASRVFLRHNGCSLRVTLFIRRHRLVPQKTRAFTVEHRTGMLFCEMFAEIAHRTSGPDGRGMKLFFANGALSDADIGIGYRFEKDFLAHS